MFWFTIAGLICAPLGSRGLCPAPYFNAKAKKYIAVLDYVALTWQGNRSNMRSGQGYGSMPIEEGIAHVRGLVELVINHHKFSVGPSVVGGKARIGLVTYKIKEFQIIS